MGLIENNRNRIFLGIANGKITRKVQGQDAPQTFSAIEGSLKGISRRTATVKGIQTEFTSYIIEDAGETYELSVQTNGGVNRGIILCLASVQNFAGNRIKITPYLSKDGEHTNVAIELNGVKISWVTKEIPAMKEVQVGSTTVKDDTERMKFVNKYLELVQQRLVLATSTPLTQNDEGDLPGDDESDNNEAANTDWMKGAEHM